MIKKNIILHIGLYKTGSTFIQSHYKHGKEIKLKNPIKHNTRQSAFIFYSSLYSYYPQLDSSKNICRNINYLKI